MSSLKDYVLEITPSLEHNATPIKSLNVLKFSVKQRTPPIICRARYWLLCGFTISLIISAVKYYQSITVWHNITVIMIQMAAIVLLFFVQEPLDTLTIMKGIGAQLDSHKLLPFQSSNTFIPINNMIDLVVHEGFHDYGQVIFYLCFLTKNFRSEKPGKDGVIQVVFGQLLPRKDVLLTVWKLSRQLLFAETRRYWRRVPGQGLKELSRFTE